MLSMQILLLIFLIRLCKLFTHSLLEFQYWQGVVEMVGWSRRQWKCWWSSSVAAHRRFCQGNRLTAVCTTLTLGGGILWSLSPSLCGRSCLQNCMYNFPPGVFILSITMVIINLTVMQWQIATVLKKFVEAAIAVPAVAIFFVVHCAWGVEREISNRRYRWKMGFDGGGNWGSL